MKIEEIREPITFEWDQGNNNKNWDKHGVTQREAEQAFFDEQKFITKDIGHSKIEARFILLGKAEDGRSLYIVYATRKGKIRVISARDTNKKEVYLYEKAA